MLRLWETFTSKCSSQSTFYIPKKALALSGHAGSQCYGLATNQLLLLASPAPGMDADTWANRTADYTFQIQHMKQLLGSAGDPSTPACPPPPTTKPVPELRLRWSNGAVPEIAGEADAAQLLVAAEMLQAQARRLLGSGR